MKFSSRASSSKMSDSKMSCLIRPKIELNRAFMTVLVTSNFDDDLIKNERACMETPFSHYKSMGNFLDPQGQLTCSQWSELAEIRTQPRFYASPHYLQVQKGIRSKATEKRWRHRFPHYKSKGAFCCYGHQSFDPSASKHYAAFPHLQ